VSTPEKSHRSEVEDGYFAGAAGAAGDAGGGEAGAAEALPAVEVAAGVAAAAWGWAVGLIQQA
jgi:hypothetical protein